MLNNNNERELVYVVKVDEINELPGYDRVESTTVGGWRCIVPKGQFKPGSLGIYFEIDSLVPSTNPAFAFMEKRNYKVKTQKMCKSISQGLLMAPEDFGWTVANDADGNSYIKTSDGQVFYEKAFLTKVLGVTYADVEDNTRKAPSVDKYKKMAQRNPKIFKQPWARWIMKHSWGRKVMFFFFGKKKDGRTVWPNHIASKTDVERIQNMIYILKNKNPYVATEKIDGSSCSIMAERVKHNKIKQYVCSRNVVFESPDDKCYYDENIYFEAYEKYGFKEKIVQIMNDLDLNNIAIQMEVFGPSVQKRTYSLKEREARVFHIVTNGIKFPMDKTVEICEKYNIPHVPIIDDNYILPDTLEELQEFVEGEGSKIDGGMKEGIVFYDKKTGQEYFKFVSPNFLLKFHN